MHLGPDLFRLGTKVKSLESFLHIRSELIYAADDLDLWLAWKGVLEDARQFRVSEIDVVVVVLGADLLSLAQLVDDVGKGKQWLVDVATLTKSFALSVGLLSAFWSCQVNQVNLTCPNWATTSLSVYVYYFNLDAEDGVRAGAVDVGVSWCELSDWLSFAQQIEELGFAGHLFVRKAIYENISILVLSDF